MREAVIVSTARTPIGKAYRGSFNNTHAQTLAGHAISEAVKRAKVDPTDIDDVILGAAAQQGTQQGNIARQSLLRAGLPTSVAGMSIDRQCASGMMAIATAAKQIIADGMNITVGGGVESVSLVRNENFRMDNARDPWLENEMPELYMTMIETAETVADRYGISRERQDEYALQSQMRTAHAQRNGFMDDEIVPLNSIMKYYDKENKTETYHKVNLIKDEGNRPDTSLEGLSALKPVFKDGIHISEGSHITAGNASQLSDGASASILMESKEAERRGLSPLGVYKGMAVAGCDPDEMGMGPVPASKMALNKAQLTVSDLDLIESNEAFAAQACAVNKQLGLNPEIVNVNGGAIALGHPVGATGAIIMTKLVYELRKRKGKYGLATMCIGGGQGIAVIIEAL